MSSGYYGSAQQRGIDRRTKDLVIRRCLPFVKSGRSLDLGYVDASWSEKLLDLGCTVDIVEGNEEHVSWAREAYSGQPRVRVFHALFQAFSPPEQYDTIIAGDMLRYVPDDVQFLSRASSWLEPGGTMIVTVPNDRSLHLRVGAYLGVISHPSAPTPNDQAVGNLRSYDRYSLKAAITAAGLELVSLFGCFLKPLDSKSIETWSDELLNAFLHVGDELQDYAWFLVAVARHRDRMRSAAP